MSPGSLLGPHFDEDQLSLEPLTEANKPTEFDCGDEDLNDFILNDALKHQDSHVAVTTILRYEGKTIAFYSIAADNIRLDDEEAAAICAELGVERAYPDYPAIKICRLAVSKEYQGRQVGTLLFLDVLGYTRELQKTVGVRYITVDAYTQSVRFYEKFRFQRNELDNQERRRHHPVSMRFEATAVEYIEEDQPAEDPNQAMMDFGETA